MIGDLIDRVRRDRTHGAKFEELFIEREIPSRAILLREGEIARQVFFIRKGCLRQWFNKDGKDITIQFFFEGQPVASIESFISGQPSMYTLESIEPTTFYAISKEHFTMLHRLYPEFREGYQDYIFERFRHYSNLFLSRIRDTPAERYEDLLKHHPEIIKRVPQRYIASYLGITPISLSRIRNRK
jgi:CRP-like cAMP-binding protein